MPVFTDFDKLVCFSFGTISVLIMNMRWLAVIIILFLGFRSQAQLCKFIVDEKDPITDDVIRTIRNRITGPIAGVSPYYYFYYVRNGSSFKIKVEVADYGELTHPIPEKSELIMRLADGSIIRIFSVASANPKEIKDFGQALTSYEIEYEISEEDIRKLVDSGVIFIRATDFKNSFSDQKIPKAVTDISKQNAICLFKE